MKAGGKPSDRLSEISDYMKQEENGRVDLNFHWLARGTE
jgi:hypothetical protein